MAGVAAAAAAWHAHGNSMALADAARPDKVTHSLMLGLADLAGHACVCNVTRLDKCHL